MNITSLEIAQATMDMFFCLFCLIMFVSIKANNPKQTSIRTVSYTHLDVYKRQLFDWFKLNSNEFALEIQSVETAELTRNILIDWIPIFEDKQVDYDIDIPEQPVRVRLDIIEVTLLLLGKESLDFLIFIRDDAVF